MLAHQIDIFIIVSVLNVAGKLIHQDLNSRNNDSSGFFILQTTSRNERYENLIKVLSITKQQLYIKIKVIEPLF